MASVVYFFFIITMVDTLDFFGLIICTDRLYCPYIWLQIIKKYAINF